MRLRTTPRTTPLSTPTDELPLKVYQIHLLRGKEILENLPGFLRDKHPPSFFFLYPVFLRGRPFDFWRGRGRGRCGWSGLVKTFFPLKHLEVSLFPPTFNGVSFSYPAVHAMTIFFFSADIFPSISFCRIFFFWNHPYPHPSQKAYDSPIPTHYLREMLGQILTENSFEFNGNNYLPAHGLQWAQKQTEIKNFNPTKRPYRAKRMLRMITLMAFLLLGLKRKDVDLFIEKHSKLNLVKLNTLLATPCKLSQGTDKLSKVEIYSLINSLISLVCSCEGHQGERFQNAWRVDRKLWFYFGFLHIYVGVGV